MFLLINVSLMPSAGQIGLVGAFGGGGSGYELFPGEVVEGQFGFGQAAVFAVDGLGGLFQVATGLCPFGTAQLHGPAVVGDSLFFESLRIGKPARVVGKLLVIG